MRQENAITILPTIQALLNSLTRPLKSRLMRFQLHIFHCHQNNEFPKLMSKSLIFHILKRRVKTRNWFGQMSNFKHLADSWGNWPASNKTNPINCVMRSPKR